MTTRTHTRFLTPFLLLAILLPGLAFAADFDLQVGSISFGSEPGLGQKMSFTVFFENASSASNGYGGEGTFDILYTLSGPDGTVSQDEQTSFAARELRGITKQFTISSAGQYTLIVKTYDNGAKERGWTGVPYDTGTGSKVVKFKTTVSASDVSFYPNASATFSARLLSGTTPLANQYLTFTVPGGTVSSRTNSSGYASATLNPSGTGTISVTYNETASYRASSDTATLGTKKFNTRLRCASSTINGVAGSQISVWGLLEQENASGDWRALPNETITLRLDGTSKSATTDSRGMGSANYTIDSVGNYTYTASYGGDSDHEDSSGSGTVKIANPPVNAGITSVLFADTSARISRDNAIPRATIKNVGTTSASFLLNIKVVDLDDSGSSPTKYDRTVTSPTLSVGQSWTSSGSWVPVSEHEYVVIAEVFSSNGDSLYGTDSAPHSKTSSRCTFAQGNVLPVWNGNIAPSNGAEGQDQNTGIAWNAATDADGDAIEYNVYLGTTSPPPYVGTQSKTSYMPGYALQAGKKYYWRVDATDGTGTRTGQEWNFTTRDTAPNTSIFRIDFGDRSYGVMEESTDPQHFYYDYAKPPVKIYDTANNIITVPTADKPELFASIQALDAIKDATSYRLQVNENLAFNMGVMMTSALYETTCVDALGVVNPVHLGADIFTLGTSRLTSLFGGVADLVTQGCSYAQIAGVGQVLMMYQRMLYEAAKGALQDAEEAGGISYSHLKVIFKYLKASEVLGEMAFVTFRLGIADATITQEEVRDDIVQASWPVFGSMWSAFQKGFDAGELYGDLVQTVLHFAPQLYNSVVNSHFENMEAQDTFPESLFFYSPDNTATPAPNNPPAATFIFNKSKTTPGTQVTMDASVAIDADGDPLTYHWRLDAPEGSSSTLTGENSVQASFVPDTPGVYLVHLELFDGMDISSIMGSVVVSCESVPAAPATLSASDNQDGFIRLTWAAVSGAQSYEVWRGPSSLLSEMSRIAVVSGTTYDDRATEADRTYYYRVTATNLCEEGGEASPYASGIHHTPCTDPGYPANVAASRGDYADRIVVSWDAVQDARLYRIWRSSLSGSSSATKVGETQLTQFVDTDIIADQSYYYWITAESICGAVSDLGSSAVGYSYACSPLTAPDSLSATDNEIIGGIGLSWSKVSGAASYEVWRGTSNNTGQAQRVATVTDCLYEDATAVDGTYYYYWVKSCNSCGFKSAFSTFDIGYFDTSCLNLIRPASVNASDDLAAKVHVEWAPVDGAMSYSLWRGTSSDSNQAVLVASVMTTSFDDTTAPQNATVYYWVEAVNSCGNKSDKSMPDTGYRVGDALPVAEPGVLQVVTPGQSVTLSGANSHDAEDAIASYSWTQTGGTSVVISNAGSQAMSFTVPSNAADRSQFDFSLTVTDSAGQQASASVSVIVLSSLESATAEARERVVSGSTGGYADATVILDSALATYPNDKSLRMLRAFSRPMAVLLNDDGGEIDTLPEVLRSLGYSLSSSSIASLSIRKLHAPQSAEPENNVLRAFLKTRLLPALDQAEADAGTITSTSFFMTLPAGELGQSKDLEVDYGDVQLYRTAISLMKFVTSFLASMDIDMSRSTFIELIDGIASEDMTTPLGIINTLFARSGTFLRFNDQQLRLNGIQALVAAKNRYNAAHDFLLNQDTLLSTGANELMSLDTMDSDEETLFHTRLNQLADSASGLGVVPLGDGKTLDFSAMSGATAPDLRDMFPAVGLSNYPLVDSVGNGLGGDPTLGGLLNGVSQKDWAYNFSSFFKGVSGFHHATSTSVAPDLWPQTFGASESVVGVYYNTTIQLLENVSGGAPAEASRIDESQYIACPIIEHDRLYYAVDNTIRCYDVLDAYRPTKKFDLTVGDSIQQLAAKAGALVALVRIGGDYVLQVYATQNDTPQLIGSVNLGNNWIDRILFTGERIYTVRSAWPSCIIEAYGLQMSGMSSLGEFVTDFYANAILEKGGILYLSGWEKKAAVNVSDMHSPVMLPDVGFGKDFLYQAFTSFGNTLIVTGTPTLQAYDITTPSSIRYVASAGSRWLNTPYATSKGVYASGNLTTEKYIVSLLDSDGDGMEDSWERGAFGNLLQSGSDDFDGDGLTNVLEMLLGTNPKNKDSDGDGISDGWEVQYGSIPFLQDGSFDADGDGASNLREFLGKSDPNEASSLPNEGASMAPVYMLLLP